MSSRVVFESEGWLCCWFACGTLHCGMEFRWIPGYLKMRYDVVDGL